MILHGSAPCFFPPCVSFRISCHDNFFFCDCRLPKHRLVADNPCDFESLGDKYLAGNYPKDRGADHYVSFYPLRPVPEIFGEQYLAGPAPPGGQLFRGISELLSSAFDEAYIFDYRRISQIGDYRAYVEKHGITDILFMQYSLRGVFDNQNDNTPDTLLPKE